MASLEQAQTKGATSPTESGSRQAHVARRDNAVLQLSTRFSPRGISRDVEEH